MIEMPATHRSGIDRFPVRRDAYEDALASRTENAYGGTPRSRAPRTPPRPRLLPVRWWQGESGTGGDGAPESRCSIAGVSERRTLSVSTQQAMQAADVPPTQNPITTRDTEAAYERLAHRHERLR